MLDVSRGHVNGKFMTVLYAAVKVFVCIVGFVFWIIGTESPLLYYCIQLLPLWTVLAGTAVIWSLMLGVVAWSGSGRDERRLT